MWEEGGGGGYLALEKIAFTHFSKRGHSLKMEKRSARCTIPFSQNQFSHLVQ